MSVLFVSLFDKNYLVKGISMIDSLLSNSIKHEILILSLDVKTFKTLNRYFAKNSRIIVKNIDFINPQILAQISNDRSYREFCWALSSVLSFTTLSCQKLDVIYLDADLYFFNSVEPLISKCDKFNAAITPHRFSDIYKHLEINGKFNVQWVYFKNNKLGKRVAFDWMNDCIISTKYNPTEGVVGDQKYLDSWPSRYENILEISDVGVGLAPWNQSGVLVTNVEKSLFVDSKEKLVFYHFHSLNIYFRILVLPVSSNYHLGKEVLDLIYAQYVKKLNQVRTELGINIPLLLSKGVLSIFLNFLQVFLIQVTQSAIWRKIKNLFRNRT
jgi:hypothetical protein